MAIFKIDKENNLEKVEESKFKLEREIQIVAEKNIYLVFGLKFISSEFLIKKFRIDTLAFDPDSLAFVIIEYKRDRNFSVIDQGYAYLSLMLNNKADFILEYNENSSNTLKRGDVDWSQSKVLFVSPSFTPHQREAVNFKDLPIELWEVKKFKNSTVAFNKYDSKSSTESIKTISGQNKNIESVSQEVVVFTEEEHFRAASGDIIDLYDQIKTSVFNFDSDIALNVRKRFIGFQSSGKTFMDIVVLKKSLKIYLNLKSGELKDHEDIARDVSNVGHWGNGAYEIPLSPESEIEYIISLIKQSFNKNKSH